MSPVLGLYAEADLVKDELGLLFAVHGAKCLHLQLTENVAGRFDVAIVILLQVGQDLGDAGALDLNKDLSLCHCTQGLDDLDFSVDARDFAENVNDGLDHLLDGLLELAMFLGEDSDLVAEQVPITGILAEGDDGNEESGCGGKIGSLHTRH